MMKKSIKYILLILIIFAAFTLPAYGATKYFRPLHWITGTVSDASGEAQAEGREIRLYYEADPGKYATGSIGLSGAAKNPNRYMLNTYAIPSTIFTWEAGDTVYVRVFPGGDGYGTQGISVETTGAGFDEALGVTLEAFEQNIIVSNVKFDGEPYLSYPTAVNVIAPAPSFEAQIDMLISGEYVAWVELHEDTNLVYSGSEESWAGEPTITFSYQFMSEMPQGDRVVRIKIWGSDPDTYAEREFAVRVAGKGIPQVIGYTLAYPTPFKPLSRGDTLRIAYNLSADADVLLILFDTAGRNLLTRKFNAGTNGGRLGYNQFEWNGATDFGAYIGNGLYIYQIVKGNKVLARGYIVVHD